MTLVVPACTSPQSTHMHSFCPLQIHRSSAQHSLVQPGVSGYDACYFQHARLNPRITHSFCPLRFTSSSAQYSPGSLSVSGHDARLCFSTRLNPRTCIALSTVQIPLQLSAAQSWCSLAADVKLFQQHTRLNSCTCIAVHCRSTAAQCSTVFVKFLSVMATTLVPACTRPIPSHALFCPLQIHCSSAAQS
jgi:hypothetical protein